MGYASAMAWVLLVIIAVFTAGNFVASKYWVSTMTIERPKPRSSTVAAFAGARHARC